jgi:hypothetical protein
LKIVQKICQNYPKSSLCDSERVNFRNLDEGQFLQQPNPDDSPTRDQIMGREITCMIEERLCHVDCRSDLSNPPSEIEEKACKDKCDEDYRCCMDAVSVYANGEQAKYHGQMVIVDDCSEGFECYYPNVCIGEIGRESCYVRNRPISQGHKAACCISGCVDPKTNCDERGGNYCTSCGLGEILEEYPRNPLLNSYCCAGPCFSIDPSGGGPPPDENYRFIIEVCDSDESGGVFPSPPESQLMLGPGPGSKPPAGGGDGGDGDSGDDGGDGGDGTGDGILCLIKICEHF